MAKGTPESGAPFWESVADRDAYCAVLTVMRNDSLVPFAPSCR